MKVTILVLWNDLCNMNRAEIDYYRRKLQSLFYWNDLCNKKFARIKDSEREVTILVLLE